MSQYRLTKKLAKDCKVKIDICHLSGASLLDDWIRDAFTTQRKKIIIATHMATLFTLFVPYANINGAKEIFSVLPRLLYR